MRRRASKSIVRRIGIASIVLVLCGLSFAVAGSLWFLYRQSAVQYEARMDRQLDVLAGSLVQPLWSFDNQTINTICETYGAHADVVRIRVFAEDARDPVCAVVDDAVGGVVSERRAVLYRGQEIGAVEIALSKAAHESNVTSILGFGLVSAALISGLVFLGIRRLLSVFLQAPLATLSTWAADVSRGRYDAMAGDIREAELQELARHFQEMAEMISARELELRKLSMATEQSPASVIITDPDGRIDYVNRTFEEITGYSAEAVRGRSAGSVLAGDLSEAEYAELWRTVDAGGTWRGESRSRTRDGREIWERTRVAAVRDDAGRTLHYVAVKEDVTLQKEQAERIAHQAHYDGLTDLPNRFLCMDRLSQLIKECRRRDGYLAVFFLDLDDFKKVNDSLGHEVGDTLLVQAARRLASGVRAEDTLGRLGGDEFLVLAGGLHTPEDATPLAEHLIEQLRQPFRIDGREMVLTGSIGIACCPTDGDTVADLLRNADTAMYHSKTHGRNTFHYFTPAMNASVTRRLTLEEHLYGALERDEFEVVYQPIVDVGAGQWRGAEALLRWNSPRLGPVSPAEFIPITEDNGLILPIGRRVLALAIEAAARWRKQVGESFAMSVNLSPRQLRDPRLLEDLAELLRQHSLPGACLTLEVTEGVLMSGHAEVGRVLRELVHLGVGIGMDDFGTGYSSLSNLRNYPFTALKIDRAFVADLTRDNADRELVSAAVRMGEALGMRVIAEGIETDEQRRVLVDLGCVLGQGFLFSRPVSESEFGARLPSRMHAG